MMAVDGQGRLEKTAVVALKDVSLSYNSNKDDNALEHIDLTLTEGEFVCLLGPSGCGKSTLLKIIAGFISPTAGTAVMDGEPINGADWHRGVVFQQPPLYPWLNVMENVMFGLKMRNIPVHESRRLAEEYIDKVGLREFRHCKPYELSGGMKQRVAIARSLVNKPRVLLMDEPFGALDALTREQMQILVRNIWWDSKCTILFITHDVDEALSLGTRVIVMSKRPGRILRELKTEFTYKISGDNSNRTRYSDQFLELREEVLNLINRQELTYQV
ncbi:ABC transporter ATP-binding protein [Propionispora vibrioides]|uniref:Taurine transport system ATP-binding protein n=1 Tax=Propionispora vibrioides TaxID=112903 RepID=A0A1H8WU87_9FIRM|nr:ABC transporter ATP-binding protein [Propionispora vibrioides]SEP31244.1 taurine transport system ATP-binding protein [Propionispora vibrioides]